MQQTISTPKLHLTLNGSYAGTSSVTGLLTKFIAWCNAQEKNWFLWMSISFVAGIGTVLPLTLATIVFAGDNNFILWVIASIANVPILVVNLAAQPAKIKLPVLFFAWMINAIIISYCLIHVLVK